MRTVRTLTAVAAVTGIAVTLGALPASAAPPAKVSVVAQHLDNPRGLSVRNGLIYIAESGHGGVHNCLIDKSTSPPTANCIGRSSRITAVRENIPNGQLAFHHPVVTNIISVSDRTGVGSGGVSAVSVPANGTVYGIMGANTHEIPPPSSVPPGFANLLQGAKRQLGQIIVATGKGRFNAIAGIGDLDWTWTLQHKSFVPSQFPDANPNAILVEGSTRYVVDAGANTLDTVVGKNVVARAFFPAPPHSPTDTVPTCVARGPDKALYVAELLGGAYEPKHARVWRITPGHKTVWATGLTTVNGCGFDQTGAFYATEFQTGGLESSNPAGDVVRITNNGKTLTHLAVGQLSFPSGFAAGPHGVYVSNCSIAPASGFGPCPTGGTVVRIPLPVT